MLSPKIGLTKGSGAFAGGGTGKGGGAFCAKAPPPQESRMPAAAAAARMCPDFVNSTSPSGNHPQRARRCVPSATLRHDWLYWHTKLLASSVFPCPLYCACLGKAQSGRLRPGNAGPFAITESGAVPFSTQFTAALSISKCSSEDPPPQWLMPGTKKNRLHMSTCSAPPLVAASDW